MTEFIIALPIGAIIGWIIREIVSDRLARDRALEIIEITEFNKAAAVFRATFVDEMFHIKRNVEPFFQRYGERREDIDIANEKAKIIFEAFLPDDMLIGFNAAWKQYKNPDKENKIKESAMGPEYYKELGKIRLSHIKNLLEFAKPKI